MSSSGAGGTAETDGGRGGNIGERGGALSSPAPVCSLVVAGAGYAGLHIAMRPERKLRGRPEAALTLVDRHEWEYRQSVTHLRGWEPIVL